MIVYFHSKIVQLQQNYRIVSKSKDRIIYQIVYFQSKDRLISAKRSYTLSFLLPIVWFLTIDAFLPICFWNRHLRYRTRFEISTKFSTFYKMARKSNWYVRSYFSHYNHNRIVLLRFIITECCTLFQSPWFDSTKNQIPFVSSSRK